MHNLTMLRHLLAGDILFFLKLVLSAYVAFVYFYVADIPSAIKPYILLSSFNTMAEYFSLVPESLQNPSLNAAVYTTVSLVLNTQPIPIVIISK